MQRMFAIMCMLNVAKDVIRGKLDKFLAVVVVNTVQKVHSGLAGFRRLRATFVGAVLVNGI